LIKIACNAKRIFDDVELTIIVPDLPQFFGSNLIYRALGFPKRRSKYIYQNINFFDNFVLLSKDMATELKIVDEKFTVVEGIYNSISNSEKAIREENDNAVKIILYTGALSSKYGIETLLNAFNSIENPDYRLVICGEGDGREIVEKIAKEDERITFMGKVSHKLILTMQKNATLLVNPRTPEGEYTKYSFPSKTMEYFASGTSVLMYKLPGIPSEYFNFCYTMDEDYSSDALSHKIIEILSMPVEEREVLGMSAKDFILQYKNPKNQVKKIIKLMETN
jgi:glycosyltransferase involved in cell wall biosynthesis